MHVSNSLYYLNLGRVELFVAMDGGASITTQDIVFDDSGTLGKISNIVPIFNGTSSYAQLVFYAPQYTKLLNASAISFGGWFYLGVVNTDLMLYHLGDSLTSGIVLEAINTNLRCIIGNYDSNYDDINGILTVGWHHIFVTCTTTQRLVYLDGEVVNTANKSYSFSGLSDTLYIGAFTGTSKFFKGRLLVFHFAASCFSVKLVKFLADGVSHMIPLYNVVVGLGLNDYSGNSRDPESHGTFTIDTDSPRYTSAVKFPGNVANYIKLGGRAYFLQFGFTLSIRFKTTLADTAQTLLDNGYHSNCGIRLLISSSNLVRVNYGNGTETHSFNGPTISTNTWYMFTLTWDCATLRLYLNGVLVYEEACSDPVVPHSSDLYLLVGKTSYQYTDNSYLYAYPFKGSLCDVRICSTPLSAQKIYELYNVPIQIDNKGTIWGYQLVLNAEQVSFTARGVVNTGTFVNTAVNDDQVHISQTEILAKFFDNM